MFKKLARNAVDTLDKSGLRRPLAAGASVATSLLGRKQNFSADEDGDWVNRQAAATFVSPDILFSRYDDKVREIQDLWCHQYVPGAGDVVIDIGAGIGDEAVVFSRLVGPSGHVYAVEAHPDTFRCLQKTIARSGLTNVTAIQCAIADSAGTLVIEDVDTQNHISHSVVKAAGGSSGVEVPALSLDGLFDKQSIAHANLLKMNIEGAERLAMQGIAQCLSSIGHYAISCHDFVADRDGGNDDLRTREEVLAWFTRHGMDVAQRLQDPRPWVRDYIYARPRSSAD